MSTACSGASCCVLFHPESGTCSNLIWSLIPTSTATRTAAWSIRRYRWMSLHGPGPANWTGGLRSAGHTWSGSDGYAVRMVSNGGLGPLICVLRVARVRDLIDCRT